MRAQPSFPITVRTGWVDYSPALHHYASERIESRLTGFAPRIRSVMVRISDDEPHNIGDRRCEVEVMTVDAGLISASSAGVDLFALVDRAVDAAVEMLRERRSAEADGELRQRIA